MPLSFTECTSSLNEARQADYDNRESAREADLFLNKRDGQWEPEVLFKWSNRPKYTFDECNPVVDEIMGELENMDFNVNTVPTNGAASRDVAELFSGIIRQIESLSRAQTIYTMNARSIITSGFGAWRVKTAYRDDDSFQQDLIIDNIPSAIDCAWLDAGAMKPDGSDAEHGWILTSLTKAQYDKRWPMGSGASVGLNNNDNHYFYKKPNEVVVGEYLYRVRETRELALLTNGAVVEVNDDFGMIYDELSKQKIEVHSTKRREVHRVHQRFFDGADWLSSPKKSIFEFIPIIPVYGNFRISENKILYFGVIEKLMDAQRVINYSESRKIEEGALAPKGKVWLTRDQAKSDTVKKALRTLNVNNDPVQLYDFTEGQPSPTYIAAPPSNPGLMETTATAQNFVQRTSGSFDEARGTAPPRRSGVAIKYLQNKSDNPKQKWSNALAIAITHTYRILVKAIPLVYDTQQMVRILGPDGSSDTAVINKAVRDEQTNEVIYLNDLRTGKYDVTCVPGPAFYTRQQETVEAITEYANIDPSILQFGADILLNNINAPGMDKLAARKRQQMVMQGIVPENQLTEQEKQQLQQIQQNKDMSPIDRANLMIAQAQLQDVQGRNQERSFKLQLEQQKLELQKQVEQTKAMLDSMKAVNEQLKLQAETLKLIKESIGANAIVNPNAIEAFDEQAKDLKQLIMQ